MAIAEVHDLDCDQDARFVPKAAILIAAIGLFICTLECIDLPLKLPKRMCRKSEGERAAIMPSAGDSHRH